MPPGPYDWAAFSDDEFPHVDPNLARRQQQREQQRKRIHAMLNSAIVLLKFRDMMHDMLADMDEEKQHEFMDAYNALEEND